MKRTLKKLKSFVKDVIFPSEKQKHILAVIEEVCSKRQHTLLYLSDRVPCDECIIGVISDAYGISRRMLRVVEKRPFVREVGCCKRKGKRGTWSIKRLTKWTKK